MVNVRVILADCKGLYESFLGYPMYYNDERRYGFFKVSLEATDEEIEVMAKKELPEVYANIIEPRNVKLVSREVVYRTTNGILYKDIIFKKNEFVGYSCIGALVLDLKKDSDGSDYWIYRFVPTWGIPQLGLSAVTITVEPVITESTRIFPEIK